MTLTLSLNKIKLINKIKPYITEENKQDITEGDVIEIIKDDPNENYYTIFNHDKFSIKNNQDIYYMWRSIWKVKLIWIFWLYSIFAFISDNFLYRAGDDVRIVFCNNKWTFKFDYKDLKYDYLKYLSLPNKPLVLYTDYELEDLLELLAKIESD